jgi:hypothetical protein
MRAKNVTVAKMFMSKRMLSIEQIEITVRNIGLNPSYRITFKKILI